MLKLDTSLDKGCVDNEQGYTCQCLDIDNIHSSGSPNSLENGQKVDIGRRKNDAGNEKRNTIDMTQRSYAKARAY